MARKRRDMLAQRDLFTLAALLVFIAQSVLFRRFSFDDTYIAYRHARHLADGLGPIMNAGERVEGVSNLPWTGLLGVLAKLDLEPHTTGPALSFLCGLFVVILVSELAARMIDDRRAGGPASLFLAASAPVAVWSVSGMETMAYSTLLTLLVWRAHREIRDARSGWGSGLLLGVVAAMRPEGVAFAFVVWLAAPRKGRWLAGVVAGALCVIAPLQVFRLLFYGEWLPNPVYAKASLGVATLTAGGVYLAKVICATPAHFLGAVVLPRDGLVSPARRLLLGWIVMQCLLLVASGGERVPGYRFIVPALPALVVCIEVGLRNLRSVAMPHPRIALVGALTAVVLGIAVAAFPGVVQGLAASALRGFRSHEDAVAHAPRLLAETRFAAVSVCAAALVVWIVYVKRRALRRVESVEGSRTSRARLGRLVSESSEARTAMMLVVVCTLLVVALPSVLDPVSIAARQPDPAVRFGRPVGEWLRESYDANTLVATNCAGSLPYFSALPIVDMLGLTDHHIARVPADTRKWTGHQKGDGDYVLSRRPEIIVFGGPEGSESPWPFPGDQEIAAAATFRDTYRLRREALEDFDFVFYERAVAARDTLRDRTAP